MDAVLAKLQCPVDTPRPVPDAPASFARRPASLPAGSTTPWPCASALAWALTAVTSPAEVASDGDWSALRCRRVRFVGGCARG